MFSSALPLLLLCSCWGLLGSASGAATVDEVYRDVVAVVSPDQADLNEDVVRALFSKLEDRVQCGTVPCTKCDLAGSVHQLLNGHNHEHRSGENAVSVSQFGAFASGAIMYLSSPNVACAAIAEGLWFDKTEEFLHNVVHHEHRADLGHAHDYIDTHGLEAVFAELKLHYASLPNEVCVTPTDVMVEVNVFSEFEEVEVGVALGRLLYHALLGSCFTA
ncbi:zinc transporter ZIP4-like [Salarias fasciatus]|uniref:zinc transporter ZIP4-like n=1 Tax=Salarias fasciatus TaxID=181472 RepID=UPI0011768C68|nr:zinc transporter ZIP4-like [Salarias fasciatus]